MSRLSAPRSTVWLAAALLAACFTADAPTVVLQPPDAARRTVTTTPGAAVISQIYGAGGNSGSTLKNDYVELFNPGTVAVNVGGWSVQYVSAAGTGTWAVTALPAGASIPAGGYYLVQESQGAGGTVNLPTPDATGTIAMSGTDGKVALVNNTTALTGACPTGTASAIDIVSYGTGNCSLPGSAAAQVLTVTTADFRNQNGCAYTGNASVDFTRATAAPRNSATPVSICSGGPPPPPVFTSITITGSASLVVGTPVQYTAVGLDQFNNPMNPQPTITWTSSQTSAVTIDLNTGLATPVAPGPSTITATSGAITQTLNVTVVGLTDMSGVIVISQIYGGGGNSGATLKNDFIELFNRTTNPVDVTGWSVQQTSAAGTGTWSTTPLSGIIQPGHYYLVQESQGANGTVDLPTPDASGTIAMGATSGKVLLSQTSVAQTGACPTGIIIVDIVGYASGTSCGQPAGAPANTTADIRLNGGCFLSSPSNPATDFFVGAPAPRNSATAAHSCVLGPLDHVTVTGNASISAGQTVPFSATPFDASGNTLVAAITWTSSDPTIASVDQTTGAVTGVAPSGNAVTISATAVANGVTQVGTFQVSVTNPGGINWIDLSASSTSFPAGFQAQLFATARNAQGGTIINANFTFTSLDPSIASIALVQNTGLITGVSGSATRPRIMVTATPVGGGTPYSFTSTPVTIEVPSPAPTSIYVTNDEFGDPTPASGSKPNDLLIVRPQYTLSYNTSRGTPNWVSYELDARQMAGLDRCNCFTADPLLPTSAQIFTSDYTNGGFDRGHMTRSADRTAGNADNAATFYLTNVVPQQADLNQGVWAQFENTLADSARIGGRAVYIITGPLYSSTHGLTTIKGEGKIAIPDSTWKIAVIGPDPGNVPFTKANVQTLTDLTGITVLAVNMPNIPGVRNDPWQKYLTTVSKIEIATGYNFLSLLSEAMQCKIEVRNCVPVPAIAVVGGSTTVAAGAQLTLNLSGTDADGADGPWKLSVDWGDGTLFNASLLSLPTDTRPQVRAHAWTAPGPYIVRVTITDKKGAQGVTTLVVTVTP